MTRGWIKTLLVACALLLLAGALRHDLANWSARQGMARLRAGDVAGADAAFRRAIDFGKPAAPLHFNLGVAHYRDHAHAPARKQFDLAIATAAPELRQAAHYNRGNSFYRQAESVSGRDRRAAITLFQQAMADYRRVLALAPGDANARGNLDLARTRLRGLESGQAQDKRDDRANAGQRQAGDPAGAPRSRDEGRAGGKTPPGERKPSSQAGSRAAGTDTPASGGKPARALTKNEVERLLNDARGREKPAGSLHGGGKLGPSAMPDKDW
jgi:tetratricopeptide (TPR) repeat protein